MNKKGFNVKGLMFMFVAIIFGIAFVTVIANTTASSNQLAKTYNETFSLTSCYTAGGEVNSSNSACNTTVIHNPPRYNFGSNCPNINIGIRAANGSLMVNGTDYIAYQSTGVIAYLNTTKTNTSNLAGNTTYQNYTYCPYGYNTDSSTRSVFDLIPLLAVLGLLVGVLFYMYKGGLFDKILDK